MMLLAPSGSDFRVADADSIPVVDGKFAFDLYVDEVMPYDLIPLDEFEKRCLVIVWLWRRKNLYILFFEILDFSHFGFIFKVYKR